MAIFLGGHSCSNSWESKVETIAELIEFLKAPYIKLDDDHIVILLNYHWPNRNHDKEIRIVGKIPVILEFLKA